MSHRIAVLVPSRGRPRNIERLHSTIMDTAADPELIDLWVRLDDDDVCVPTYLGMDLGSQVRYRIGPRTKLAASWNELAEVTLSQGAGDAPRYTHLALWGDDVVPETQAWDKAFIARLLEDGPGYAYSRDGIWDHTFDQQVPGQLVLPTACVMSREIAEAMGYVSMPGLVHLCIDVGWRDLGVAAGCLFYEPTVMIRHLHRLVGALDDDTYREANDDQAQVHGDNLAYTKWRNGPEFLACLERVKVVVKK